MTLQELYNGLYNDAVPNTTVVEVWRDWDGDPVKSTVNATAFNHSVIVAAYAYLDHEDGWRSYYGYSPLPPSYRITIDQQKFIWGGEGNMSGAACCYGLLVQTLRRRVHCSRDLG